MMLLMMWFVKIEQYGAAAAAAAAGI